MDTLIYLIGIHNCIPFVGSNLFSLFHSRSQYKKSSDLKKYNMKLFFIIELIYDKNISQIKTTVV